MRFCEAEKCNYPVFGTCKKTGKGYCKSHQRLRMDWDSRSIMQKAIQSKQKSLNSKIRSLNKPDEDDNLLELFFLSAAVELRNRPRCANCGAYVHEKFFRAATAHVLPKRKEYGFPSISTHPENRIFLGAGCGCHNLYDRTWEDASKMSIWPEAVRKFKILYPFIHPSELKNIPNILLETLL